MGLLHSFELEFSSTPLLAVLVALAAGAIAWFFYRVTLPPVARPYRILLTVLRGAALALVLLLLFEPVLRSVTTVRESAVVAVLADRSESMTIADAGGSRSAELRRLLTSVIPGVIPPGTAMALYSFGATLRGPLQAPPDSLTDEVTDIAGALGGLAHEKERRNIRAAIILSDGAVTRGENPALRAEAAGIPIFTVGIGDTAEQKDVLVAGVMANDVVYAGTEAPVDVTIRSSGYGGTKAEVTLEEGGRVLDRTLVTLPSG
ncbi:MAG TPA: vWA domain-containing protein, partial [Bacteroidota bacterium]|nr:vWA domain-containing protein [Bacteroidota bacterium]